MTNNTETNHAGNMATPCFLIGLGTGIALTLMFAPASGASTRRLISRKFRASEDWVKDKAEQVASAAEVLRGRAEDAAQRIGLA